MTTNTIAVKTQHREYQENIGKWQKVRNVLSGNFKQFLRDVSSSENDAKYATKRQTDYEDGAVFYNFTKRTLSGMIGAVTRKQPEVILPAKLEYLRDNCDGAGLGIVQQSQDALKEIDSIGRGGLLADAPNVAAATRAEQNAGKLNPRIQLYTAENIVNWRKEAYGSTYFTTMIVLREMYEYTNLENEFMFLVGERYRVLEIVDGKYQQRVFEFDATGAYTGDIEPIIPTVNGKQLDYIPFYFIGSDNNDSTVDSAPLESLCDVNIGHVRNSADVEESSFIASQPTLMVYPGENMSPQVFKDLNPNGIRIGSRTGHNLGAGGNAALLQAQPSNLAKELMLDKENQAVMIGAQLITPTAQITAESARLQRGADTSIMATIAINVSMAYEQAIKTCAEMLNVTGDITFELNTEFFMQQMTAQDRAAWMADINAGLLPMRAYYTALRASGVTNWDDEDIESSLTNQNPSVAPSLDVNVSGDIPANPEG